MVAARRRHRAVAGPLADPDASGTPCWARPRSRCGGCRRAPVWLAAAWVAMESIRCTWPAGGMPWGRLSYAVVDTPVAGALPFVGATGVSLVLALTGDAAGGGVPGRDRRAARPAVRRRSGRRAGAGDGPGRRAVLRTAETGQVAGGRRAGQRARQTAPTCSPTTGRSPRSTRQETERLATDVSTGRVPEAGLRGLARELHGPRPLRGPADARRHRRGPERPSTCRSWPASSSTAARSTCYNQGIVFDPVTGAGDRYTKWHPVPFGEYIPWRWLFGSHLAQLNAVPRDMVHGTRVRATRRGRHPGGRRDLLRRRLRRRALRPGVPRRPAGGRPDQQRGVHPHRPGRPAVRDQPAARDRDPPLRRRGRDQRHHRGDRARRVRGGSRRRAAPSRTSTPGSDSSTR